MGLRCGLCSDINLEHHFKHMTSKRIIQFEKDQLIHFDNFVEECIKQKLEVLFIVGNIFGNTKPHNKTIEHVVLSLKKLSEKGMIIFLSPGSHDMPLFFSNDRPAHHIFESIDNIHFLQYDDYTKGLKTIIEPVWEGKIKDIPIQIFTPKSPFIRPNEIEYKLKSKKTYTKIFLLSNIYNFKKDIDNIFKGFIEKLNQTNIDLLFLGGYPPKLEDEVEVKSNMINCPPLHQSLFDFHLNPNGLLVGTLVKNNFKSSEEIIPITTFHMKQEFLDVGAVSNDNVNDEINLLIENNSNNDKGIFQLVLRGKVKKERYHNIRIYKFKERGSRMNYYFELQDKIEFADNSPIIERIKVIDELKSFKDSKIDEVNNSELFEEDQKKNEISVIEDAFKLIKKDWEE